ncbi:hypothetical protein OCU04_005679 [Sclerotinia nivalis]|uniref:Uncharacterized protein n=1 Tax=Sclerotinia nivalis TaxID=352851 RepID=A0A9X0DK72_9HELO|nr:hypothetical protein OCU04_005679 [Sclerotinia nivalis]
MPMSGVQTGRIFVILSTVGAHTSFPRPFLAKNGTYAAADIGSMLSMMADYEEDRIRHFEIFMLKDIVVHVEQC